MYVHTESNHPATILKTIPENINRKISNTSATETDFNEASKIYQEASDRCGYNHKLKFESVNNRDTSEKQRDKRKQTRNISWFNAPFSENVATNIGKKSFKLLDSSFASGSIDGTIVLWSTQSLLPSRYFNTRSDYEGADHLYPYSVQYMLPIQQRYLIAAVGSGFSLYDTITGRMLVEKHFAHLSKIQHLTFVCDGMFLATCSEDGSIRLWGHGLKPQENTDWCKDPLETFLGMSVEELKQMTGNKPVVEPVLMGECLAHSGGVQMLVDCGHEGIVSCGMDTLVIVWKNAELQRRCRNRALQEKVFCMSGIV
ncbi:hypothetical protein ScPMuIL_018054 [Solemya velum]